MLDKQANSVTSHVDRGFYSQLFLVPKKDGSQRPVVTLKKLNLFVKTEYFKVEGNHMLKDFPRPGDWMAKVDLKDPNSSGILRLPTYQLERPQLPVQLSPLRTVLCAMGLHQDPVAATPRELGVRMIVYIDNILIMAESAEGSRHGPGLSIGEPRVRYQLPKVPVRAHPGN
jgi:hypothetical protein